MALAVAGLAFVVIALAHGGAHWLAARRIGQPTGIVMLMPGLGCAACARGERRPARALVHLAGPIAGYLALAIVAGTLFAAVPMVTGASRLVVEDIANGGAADGVLATGDVIVAVDGHQVSSSGPSVAALIEASRDPTVELQIVRAGAPRRVELAPRPDPATGKPRIGVQLGLEWLHIQLPLGSAIARGFVFPLTRTAELFGSLIQLFSPTVADDPGGPVRIARGLDLATESDMVRAFRPILDACVLLALALGVFDVALAIAVTWRSRRRGNAPPT